MALLVSIKMVFQYLTKTAIARDWRVVMVPEDECSTVTFADLYQKILNHVLDPMEPFILPEEQKDASIRVQIGKEQTGSFQDIPLAVRVADAMPTFGIYIKYFIQCEDLPGTSVPVNNPRRNAFEVRPQMSEIQPLQNQEYVLQVLMSSQKKLHLPSPPSEIAVNRSKKECLKKDIITVLGGRGLGWTTFNLPSVGEDFVNTLTNTLWYFDGHFTTFEERSCHIPDDFKVFEGYNKPEKSKHRKKDATNLSASILDCFATSLNQLILQPCFDQKKWESMKKSVGDLADSMTKYALYLCEKNEVVQENHGTPSVIRSVSDVESVCILPKAVWVKPDTAMKYRMHCRKNLSLYLYYVNDYAPVNAR